MGLPRTPRVMVNRLRTGVRQFHLSMINGISFYLVASGVYMSKPQTMSDRVPHSLNWAWHEVRGLTVIGEKLCAGSTTSLI